MIGNKDLNFILSTSWWWLYERWKR